jgi:predicted ATP-grasp superfamily ATP-dependent carboligase
VKRKRYGLLISCTDYSTNVISQNRNRIEPYTKVFLPNHEKIRTVTSKYHLMKYALNHSIPIPKTYRPKDSSDLKGHLKYPIVIKGDETSGARKVRYAYSREELIGKYEEIRKIDTLPIIQEFIEGKDKFFYGLCDKGEVRAYFMLEVIRSYPPTGGNPSKAVSIYDQELRELSFKFLKSISWEGIMGLDFRQENKTGKYYLLDFNPRFGATIALAIKSGVDFPWLLYRLAVEGKREYVLKYSKAKYRSLLTEDIRYALSRPSQIPRLLLEFLEPGVFYGFDKNDLKPFICKLLMSGKSLIKNLNSIP